MAMTKKMTMSMEESSVLWRMIDEILKLVSFPGAGLSDIKLSNSGTTVEYVGGNVVISHVEGS
jgi:hypothetical protein